MKTIEKAGAQGDILLRRVNSIPESATRRQASGVLVLAHSETGHHHECEEAVGELWDVDELISYLEVKADHADIVHRRAWDTHETVRIGRGIWEIRRQREYTPEGWRRVAD